MAASTGEQAVAPVAERAGEAIAAQVVVATVAQNTGPTAALFARDKALLVPWAATRIRFRSQRTDLGHLRATSHRLGLVPVSID